MAIPKIPLQPQGNHIIVAAQEPETTTPSGIVIASSNKNEKPQQGVVMAIGPGKLDDNGKRVPIDLEVGMQVVFRKYSPDEVEWDGETYLVMQDTDVIAVITK